MKYFDLTVVTVCKNAISVLPRCVDSIQPLLAFTDLNVEYLVVDGASVDGSLEYIQKSYEEGKITRFVSEADNGLYYAMNKAIFMASGLVTVFINADDTICSEVVRDMVMPIVRGECQYTVGRAKMISSSLEKIIYPRMDLILWRHPYCHQSMFVETALLRSINGFDVTYRIAADTDLMRRLYLSEISYKIIPYVSSHFYAGGISSTPAMHAEVLNLLLKYKDACVIHIKNHPWSIFAILKHLRYYTRGMVLTSNSSKALDERRNEVKDFFDSCVKSAPLTLRLLVTCFLYLEMMRNSLFCFKSRDKVLAQICKLLLQK